MKKQCWWNDANYFHQHHVKEQKFDAFPTQRQNERMMHQQGPVNKDVAIQDPQTTMANYLPPFDDAPSHPEPVTVLQTTVVPSFALQKQRELLPLGHRVQMKRLVHYPNHDD
jgi:hypothetical protein